MKFISAILLALPALALAKVSPSISLLSSYLWLGDLTNIKNIQPQSSSAVPSPSSSSIPRPSSSSIPPQPSSTSSPGDALAVCESQAGPYTQFCATCLDQCDSRVGQSEKDCYYSVFSAINYIQSECEAMGGFNCEMRAVNEVCGSSSWTNNLWNLLMVWELLDFYVFA